MPEAPKLPASGIQITVVENDALTFSADVLLLKCAQELYGADRAACAVLRQAYPAIESDLPKPGDYKSYDSRGQLGSKQVIFVGVLELVAFSYKEIRQFGQSALRIAAGTCPKAHSLALTVHGPGYGLDELACFESLVAGLLDGIAAGTIPLELEQITILEKVPRRARRFAKELNRLLEPVRVREAARGSLTSEVTPNAAETLKTALKTVGYASDAKPLLFVAMPFREDMQDHYDYGILHAAERAGFLCERADQSHFSGDVMEWVRKRIDASTLVLADLSYANPNVYLEVGYAWGRGKPTVLVIRDPEDLTFDVRGQRCLVYKRIKDLENRLYDELSNLKPNLSNLGG
jgi:hypothetical protein